MFHSALLALSLLQVSAAGTVPTCAVVDPGSNDGALLAPENHKVLLDTADVRVIEVTQAPHSKEVMHTHLRPFVFYIDRLVSLRYVAQGDEAHAVTQGAPPPGMKPVVVASPPEPMHAVENLSGAPFHAMRVELKHPGCDLLLQPAVLPDANDELVASPESYTLLLDSPDVRVVDVVIAPHARDKPHTEPWVAAVYEVQPQPSAAFAGTGGGTAVRSAAPTAKAMQAMPSGLHVRENLGDAPLHEVRFELKHAGVR